MTGGIGVAGVAATDMTNKHLVPDRFFFTSGVGRHEAPLVSFGRALRDAGIEHLNLVTVSSIVPPGCQIIPKDQGVSELDSGEIAFVVLSRNESSDSGRLISASIGCAIPRESYLFGYLAEYHANDCSEEDTLSVASGMAEEMYTTLTGDCEVAVSGIAKDAIAGDGWTTVVCAAVFLLSAD